jgi:MFS transporter, DHA3 family, multidrug efflux protein
MRPFYQILTNTLFVSVFNATVWFAITFYSYLQTQSVMVTGFIGGIYLVATALSGFWLGSLVDHYRKKTVLILSSVFSLAVYLLSFIVYISVPTDTFKDQASPLLWLFVILLLLGVIAGNVRNIVMPTLVTMLIPEEGRAKANGLVGTVGGSAFLVTSVISGVLVGHSGMYWVLILAMVINFAAIIHLGLLHLEEHHIAKSADEPRRIDIKGTMQIIHTIPGLFALILFATFNNFLGGVFMALMDPYGLSLISVEAWGFFWGILSTGFIVGGLLISRWGLGRNPLRTLLMVNVAMWVLGSVFTVNSSIILLGICMYAYMLLVPFAEASEQTLLQKVVPYERQGRVFGFAQSVEQAASPLTAFLIGPLTQLFFIPLMTDGAGADLIGSWYGTGQERGIALVFTITGIIGLCVTILAIRSKYYPQLSQRYLNA